MVKKLFNWASYRGQLIVDYLKLRKWMMTEKTPLAYRLEASDLRVFRQIFLDEVYHFFPAGFQPKTIIDAGANVGFSSIWFARMFPNSEIYTLEPEPSNFKLLDQNATRFPAIRPFKIALWSSEMELSIFDPGN